MSERQYISYDEFVELDDAESETCLACAGSGMTEEHDNCAECEGTGAVYYLNIKEGQDNAS